MAEDDVKRLVFSIMKFLNKQKANNQGEVLEQIEVAQQFLESAYGFTLDDSAAASQYDVHKDLLDIFVDAVGSASAPAPSAEEMETRKTKAEERKTKGNELMKSERFEEALAAYTDAITLHNKNAVYFCNRAAAHSKLGNHQDAVDDCVTALEIDPTYSKAYGRMGLAFSALGRHEEALDRYKKALQLDPANESYKNNMKIAEEKSREGTPPVGGANPMANLANMFGGGGAGMPGGMPGGMPPGMPDMTSLLGNPQLMSMATQMMQNPEVQNLMTSLMTGGGGGGGPPTGGAPSGGAPSGGAPPGGAPPSEEAGPPGGMDNLLRAGQQLAEQLQSSNPELVAQLRQQMGGGGGGNGGTNNGDNDEMGNGPGSS